MRLQICVSFCLLAPGVEVNAFQTSALGLRTSRPCWQKNAGLPRIHRPRGAFTSTSASKHGRVGISLPTHNRRATSLLNAALEDGASGDNMPGLTERPSHDNDNTSSNDENVEDGSADPGNEAYDPICRVVASSDGKISPLAARQLSPSSKSLLEKIELLYSVQSQKELRNLDYVSPRNVYHSKNSLDEMGNADGNMYGVPRAMSDIAQEEKLISILKQSLEDGGFKLMDQRDLDLCSALNAGYLLRLSLLPDNKGFDTSIGKEFYPELYEENEEEGDRRKGTKRDEKNVVSNNKILFDGRVLIFRRGYSKEISTGRLLLPKLDYLQASLVQRSSTALTRKLGGLEQQLEDSVLDATSQLNSAVKRVYLRLLQQFRDFIVSVVENFGLSKNGFVASITGHIQTNDTSDRMGDVPQNKTSRSASVYNVRGNKIFRLSRYQTSSRFIPDSLDLNDALTPFLLYELGGANATRSVEQDMYDGIDVGHVTCQYDDALFSIASTNFEGRGPLEPSYKPSAVRLLERVSIQNTVDFFSEKGRDELIKNFFRSSTLVEPAYEEVIVIWRPMRKKKPKPIRPHFPPKWLYEVSKVFDMEDRLPKPKNNTRDDTFDDSPMPLEIKAFYDVPMANIEAVLPKAKLVFRPADAIVFDLVSVISFLAVAGSLKFDNPRLDLIAAVSLIFFAVRTFFRYSNKYARYDLLVNKFLTSKLAHRGPGALKYIVSEGRKNKALRAMLIHDWLSKWSISKSITHAQLDAMLGQGKSYVNEMSSMDVSQIDVDVMSALDDLEHLNLIDQYEVRKEQEALDSIKQLWDDIFE